MFIRSILHKELTCIADITCALRATVLIKDLKLNIPLRILRKGVSRQRQKLLFLEIPIRYSPPEDDYGRGGPNSN